MAFRLFPRGPAHSPKHRIIELFGLPGAGKTTIINGLQFGGQMISREEASAAWRDKSFLNRASILARILPDFAWMRSIIALVFRTPLTKGESLLRLSRLAATKPWLRSLDGNLLFDQGMLQRLWSIFYTEGVTVPPRAVLTRLLKQYYAELDVVIVVIEVSPELASQRVHGRSIGSSRLDLLPADEVLTKLRNTAGLPGALLTAAREAGLSVMTLDGSASPGEVAAKLQAIIEPQKGQADVKRRDPGIRPCGGVAAK